MSPLFIVPKTHWILDCIRHFTAHLPKYLACYIYSTLCHNLLTKYEIAWNILATALGYSYLAMPNTHLMILMLPKLRVITSKYLLSEWKTSNIHLIYFLLPNISFEFSPQQRYDVRGVWKMCAIINTQISDCYIICM